MASRIYALIAAYLILCGCSGGGGEPAGRDDRQPAIFPDYAGVTVPPNIAPLNFGLTDGRQKAVALFEAPGVALKVKARSGQFKIPRAGWKKLLAAATVAPKDAATGGGISVTISGYAPFTLHVAPEPVDPYLTYRLIEPGYTLWSRMGIYQRNLANYRQTPVMENKSTGNNCMNCHSFGSQDPDKMLFHMRATYPGTYLVTGDKIEKLNTKTDRTVSALVYPSWHPSGRYVAFSVNDTKQNFHLSDPNRIEVYDRASDVVVYDVEAHELVTAPELFSPDAFETFPTFSPDGRTLYFCSASAKKLPEEFREVRYSLCSVSFDPGTRAFGPQVDTLYNAEANGRSVSLPRVSPDGKYLLYTLSEYGNFFIWHKDADLWMVNIASGEHYPLSAANSDDADSYHSWSGNSRWIVFSSRRTDGLYTRPYITYIDADGQAHKPFVLPQKDTRHYRQFMKSYNVPEFVKGKIPDRRRSLVRIAKESKGIDIRFSDEGHYPVTESATDIAH